MLSTFPLGSIRRAIPGRYIPIEMEENVSNGRHHQNFESVVRRHLATDVRSNERFEEELDDDADEEMVGVTDGQAEMNRHNTVVTEAAPAEPENVEVGILASGRPPPPNVSCC